MKKINSLEAAVASRDYTMIDQITGNDPHMIKHAFTAHRTMRRAETMMQLLDGMAPPVRQWKNLILQITKNALCILLGENDAELIHARAAVRGNNIEQNKKKPKTVKTPFGFITWLSSENVILLPEKNFTSLTIHQNKKKIFFTNKPVHAEITLGKGVYSIEGCRRSGKEKIQFTLTLTGGK